ncbi:hypothetical protein ACFW1I_32075, partial [Streptomyces sp. NPDC058955]
MTLVAIVNPNTDEATTRMMAAIARRTLRAEDGYEVRGVTVAGGPPRRLGEGVRRAPGRPPAAPRPPPRAGAGGGG